MISDVDLANLDLAAARPDAARPDAARPDAGQANQYALAFNGIDANVVLGAMLYSSPPIAITVEAWIKPASLPVPFAHIIYNGRNGEWTLAMSSELSAGPSLGQTWFRVNLDAASTAKLVGGWHHVAMTWSQADRKVELYVDGTSGGTVPTGSGGLSALQTGYRPTIGSYCNSSNSSSFFYQGLIDEVRIWNVARTQAQLQSSMTRMLQGTEPGLIGYWRFDHGSGSTAYDSSAGGHNGVINNASWTTDTPF